jgi:peptidoglycan/LPS O-acetylase OafA/YrhL
VNDAHRPELDGLRGFAALIVVASHISNQVNLWGRLFGQGGGQLGVMLFFVLSGYLMAALYLPQRFSPAHVAGFAVRRVARVAPLYLIVVMAAFAIVAQFGRDASPFAHQSVTAENLWRHLALIEGVSVLWTIPVEMQFYALFVLLWAISAWRRAALLAVCAGLIAAHFLLYSGEFGKSLPQTIAWFAAGVGIGALKPLHASAGFTHAASAALLSLLVATLLLLPNLGALVGIARPPGRFDTYSWSHPLYLLVTVGLLYAALHASIAPAMLANRVMRWLGAISYSVYLLHLPIIIYLDRFTPLGDRPLAFAGAALGADPACVVCLTLRA